jgi:hypothetical protein
MLFPRSHAWTPVQRLLRAAAVVLGLVSFGTLVYSYERYHRDPGESALYGTWQDPTIYAEAPLYYEFRPDHTFSVVSMISGEKTSIVDGRWFAGGPNVYLRYAEEMQEGRRPLIWHIVDISANELRIRLWPDGDVYIFKRVKLAAPNASNQTMQLTATRLMFTLSMTRLFPPQFSHAPGSRS